MKENNTCYNLTVALQYDSYGEKYLTDFDRMFIHKKISSMLNEKEYELPQEIVDKLIEKLTYIQKSNWQSPF